MPVRSATVIDLTSFSTALEVAFSKLAGIACRVMRVEAGVARRDVPLAEALWYDEPGGGSLGLQLSSTLAEALVSYRYGGSLNGHDGQLGSTASVIRLQAELTATLLGVAAASWLTEGREWLITAVTARERTVLRPSLHELLIELQRFSCSLRVGISPAMTSETTAGEPAWARDVRRSLEHVSFPVRAVLFEMRLPLANAAQLRPGDVLPIETPREVGLRVGALRLASGTIAPTDDGGHIATVRGSARSRRQSPSEKAPI